MKLKLGAVLTITELENDERRFRSRVVDIAEDYLLIDYPIDVKTGRTAFLVDGTELSAVFTDDVKNSYRFSTTIQGRRLTEIPVLQITYDGDSSLTKIQRREFVRVETNVDVAVEEENGEYVYFVTTDISAGGLALNLPSLDALQEKSSVSLLVVLPFTERNIAYVRATANVVRVFEKEGRIIGSLEFTDIKNDDQQHVIQYCFERELQLKKKLEY